MVSADLSHHIKTLAAAGGAGQNANPFGGRYRVVERPLLFKLDEQLGRE